MAVIRPKTCSANLFGKEGYCGTISGANVALSTLGDINFGIIRNVNSTRLDDSTSQTAGIQIEGECPALAGGVITEDAFVKPDATGRLIACSSLDRSKCKALTAASAAGVWINVMISHVPDYRVA